MDVNTRGSAYRLLGNNPVQTIVGPLTTVESSDKSPPVSGQIVHINGQVFRKATPYARRHFRIQPGASQSSSATWKKNGFVDQPVKITSTPGGANPGFPEYAVMYPGIKNVNTGMNALKDYPTIPGSMQNEAVTKALLNLVSDSAGLGENLATMGQTVRLLANPLTYIVNKIRFIRNTRSWDVFIRQVGVDALSHRPTDVARRYLEYVYGIKPLMQDVYDTVHILKEMSNKPLLIRGRGVSKRYASGPVTVYDEGFNGSWTQVQFNTKSEVRCNLWAQVDPNSPGIRALNQLGLANPASLAWDLMPWSFIIDWVLPIGSVLQALTASHGLTWVDGSVSCRLKGRGTYAQHLNFDTREQTGISHSNATGIINYDGYNRQTLGSFPMPGLWLDQDPMRGDRPLKALALSVLALGSLK